MKIYLSFTVAASKMFFRRKSSIFWSLFFPVVTMLVLGNAGFIGYSAPNVGLYLNGEIDDETVNKLKASNSINIRDYLSVSFPSAFEWFIRNVSISSSNSSFVFLKTF